MDLITQSLYGALAAGAVARRGELRAAAAVGAAAGLLPDADMLIRSGEDPLLWLEYHRHFTHALAFVPLGALVAALLAWPLARRRLAFPRIYLYALAAYAVAPLLDAATSYGTHLLWPFRDETVAWRVIAIVDPVFTVAGAVALALALRRRAAGAARWGLVVGALYLGLGALQHERAEALAMAHAAARGHEPARLLVKPTFANLVLWRAVYVADGRVHAAGVRVALGTRVYPGASAPLFDPARDLPGVPRGSVLWQDVERFERFADGLLAPHPEQPRVLGDVRYALLPTSLRPLWGIRVDPQAPGRHVRYVTERELDAETRRRFLAMLRGRDAGGPPG